MWDLRLERAVVDSPGISLLVRELEGGFKPLGYVQEARTMLFERGPDLPPQRLRYPLLAVPSTRYRWGILLCGISGWNKPWWNSQE